MTDMGTAAAVTALAATATAAAAETLQLTSTHVSQVSLSDASHAAELSISCTATPVNSQLCIHRSNQHGLVIEPTMAV